MPLPTPNLDDRTFDQLLAEAKAHVARRCPEWTDLDAHDPGAVLLEAFAHITETMLYRMNRLPEKAYIEFLRLIGVKLQAPAAARTRLEFSLDRPASETVVIPRGTRVAAKRGDGGRAPPVFTTAQEVRLAKGATSVSAIAYQCDLVDGELVGRGNGRPGQRFTVQRPPIVDRTGDDVDLVVAVETPEASIPSGVSARRVGDRVFRVWREVESFAHAGADPHVYVADRLAGTISFAPVVSLLDEQGHLDLSPRVHAAVPPIGSEVRVWGARGGGPEGNLAAGALEVLKDPIPGLKVTNPQPATGGRAAETVANSLLRGPEEIHSLRRAVTARDFEALARRSAGGIARARAVTQAEVWTFAPPGTVEVLLVPELPPDVRGPADEGITIAALDAHQTDLARMRVQSDLDSRRPMGTRCIVSWARYKMVAVKASLLASRSSDPAAIRARVVERLHRYINPLPSGDAAGWSFGEPLARSTVYFILQSEPGVLRVDDLRLVVEDVPSDVAGLASDPFQPQAWYAADHDKLYRSLNDGEGWEVVGRFPNESAHRVKPHPMRPGLLALATRLPDGKQSRLHLSEDCGETWSEATHTLPIVEDMAWMLRDGAPVLLLATDAGLFELTIRQGATPLQVAVDPGNQDRGFWSVAAAMDARGAWLVATAALENGGVFLSETAGRGQTYRPIGLNGEDVRVLEMQQEGSRTFLWAGMTAASGAEQGKGCRVWELTGAGGWKAVDKGWDGGSCRDLAFDGSRVFAATHRAGVLWWDASAEAEPWKKPDLTSGLPLREREKLFHPVAAVAAQGGLLLVAGPAGVFRSRDARSYESCSQTEVARELFRLPSTWLLCSGKHEIDVRIA